MELQTLILLLTFLTSQNYPEVTSSPPLYDVTTPFEFSKPMEYNKLGIYTTIMIHMEFKANEKAYLWRTNTKFTNDDLMGAYQENCDTNKNTIYSEEKGDNLSWGNCTFSENQITVVLEQGTGEHWNKNFTYVQITTKPFTQVEGDIEKTCILNEFPYRLAYVVLITNVFEERSPDVEGEPIYKLDSFMPFAKSFFEEVIDTERIIQFYPIDFMNQKPRYKCFIAIASGHSVEEVRKHCKFSCKGKNDKGPGDDKPAWAREEL